MSQENNDFFSVEFDNFIKDEITKIDRFSDFTPRENLDMIENNDKLQSGSEVPSSAEKKLITNHPAPWHSGVKHSSQPAKATTFQDSDISMVIRPETNVIVSNEKHLEDEKISEEHNDATSSLKVAENLNPLSNSVQALDLVKQLWILFKNKLVSRFKINNNELFSEIYNLFKFSFKGKEKNLIKVTLLSLLLIFAFSVGKNYLTFGNVTSKVQAATIAVDTSRSLNIDEAFARLQRYMENNIDSNNFNITGNFNIKHKPGLLIVTTKTSPCWYFGAVGSEIFEPRLDETNMKCNLENF